ncbi:MAG: alpha/beta hydrolase [Planctomyces sp.]|nr:alpha/beta hydrolase [Planctomyces sp.]
MIRLRSAACLLCVALCPFLTAEEPAETPVVTGTALDRLGDTPPAPPPGYPSSSAALLAVQLGMVPTVDMKPELPADVELESDVKYGRVGERDLLLDVYRPKDQSEPLPLLVFIHGGGWRGGNKADYRVYAVHFAQRGYVVASVGYRLSGEAQYPAAVHDVKCAIRWLRSQAAELKIDPDRIGVVGGSAGGHLAMMIGYSADVPELDGDGGSPGVSSRVQAVVNIYGPCDLTTDFVRENAAAKNLCRGFFGGEVDELLSVYQQASPITHLTADDPPTLILHGTTDDVVPIDQSDILSARLQELEIPYVYDRLPGWPHTMDLTQACNDRAKWFMDRFLDATLKPAPESRSSQP